MFIIMGSTELTQVEHVRGRYPTMQEAITRLMEDFTDNVSELSIWEEVGDMIRPVYVGGDDLMALQMVNGKG